MNKQGNIERKKQEYESYNIGDLRSTLVRLGGTPANKNKATLIDEIVRIEMGVYKPVRSNRGRPSSRVQAAKDEEKTPAFAEVKDSGKEPEPELKPKRKEAVQVEEKIVEQREAEVEGLETDGVATGILELSMDGYGFIRVNNFDASPKDAFIARPTIKKYMLREGDKVKGTLCKMRENQLPQMVEVLEVNDHAPAKEPRVKFDDLIPYYPDKKIELGQTGEIPLRLMDIFCPIGKGQRGLVVAPPKTGKTTLLKKMACSIQKFHPEIHLMVLLVDERPEEVTDFKQCVSCEIIASTFDQSSEHHLRLSELCFKRAKALVEEGKDVFILMDSITKLTRACNVSLPGSGRLLSGGIDPMALQAAKKLFGLARNTKVGSLTVISTALVDTGSRLDDIVFEEFKGTGNMEINLSRELAERRIFPAIDILKSGTRRDEYLLTEQELKCAYKMRKITDATRFIERIMEMMEKTKTNDEFLSKYEGWLSLSKMG